MSKYEAGWWVGAGIYYGAVCAMFCGILWVLDWVVDLIRLYIW